MSERVGTRLREHGLAGRTVTVKVRFPDFRTITRSTTADGPFSGSAEIARLAVALLDKVDTAGGIRLLGVTMSNLTNATALQESLFGEPGSSSDDAIQSVVDKVRSRFGSGALGPAATVDPPSG